MILTVHQLKSILFYKDKACGYSPGYEDYKYIYFAKPVRGYLNYTVCVKECPENFTVTTLDCKLNSII